MSWARRGAGTRTGRRCATATRTARSRSAAVASRSSGRGCGPLTASPRSSLRPISISLIVIRSPGRAGADARRRLDPAVSAHAGAGRRGDRDQRAVDVEVGGVTDVRGAHPRGAGRADVASACGSAAGGDDARRPGAEGPDDDRRVGDHHAGREGPARAVGRIDGERDRRDRAALRPRRARPGSRAGDAVRARRLQGAAQGGPLGVRRGARSSAAVGTKNATSASTSPSATAPGQGQDAPGVAGDRLPARARAAQRPRRRARAHPPWRRRLAARGDGGDADRDRPRDQGQAQAHAGVHERVRVDDRHRPHAPSATSSTGPAARWACAGPPPACSKPRSSSARSSATPTSHGSPSRSNADSTSTSPTRPRPRRPPSQSLCNDHTGTAVTEVPRRRDNLTLPSATARSGSRGLAAAQAMNLQPPGSLSWLSMVDDASARELKRRQAVKEGFERQSEAEADNEAEAAFIAGEPRRLRIFRRSLQRASTPRKTRPTSSDPRRCGSHRGQMVSAQDRTQLKPAAGWPKPRRPRLPGLLRPCAVPFNWSNRTGAPPGRRLPSRWW